MSDKFELKFVGPFTVVPNDHVPHIRTCTAARTERGIYLVGAECDDGYLVNYVGETHGRTQTLLKRIEQGVKWDRDNMRIDAQEYLENRTRKMSRKLDLNAPDDRTQIEAIIDDYRFFVAPVDSMDKHLMEAIEGTVINRLHDASERCRRILYNPRSTKTTLNVAISCDQTIVGLVQE